MFDLTKRTYANGRTAVFSGSVFEPKLGFARGVRVGNLIFIAGTVAVDAQGKTVGSTIVEQTEYVLRKVRDTVRELGGDLRHVVRTDTFLVDFAHFDEYAAVHRRYFGETPPVNTTVQVVRFVNADQLIEIGALAVVEEK